MRISILEKYIQSRKQNIIKNSDEKSKFISNITDLVKSLNTIHINSIKDLESTVQKFTDSTDKIWLKHLKMVNITRYLKLWWNDNCWKHLDLYRNSKQLEDWKTFKKIVKTTKREFFDEKIQEILNRKKGLCDLINWVKKCKLPAIKAIKYNGRPYLEIEDLWQALYESFNTAQNWQVDTSILK